MLKQHNIYLFKEKMSQFYYLLTFWKNIYYCTQKCNKIAILWAQFTTTMYTFFIQKHKFFIKNNIKNYHLNGLN